MATAGSYAGPLTDIFLTSTGRSATLSAFDFCNTADSRCQRDFRPKKPGNAGNSAL
jgi:hypothetical protein